MEVRRRREEVSWCGIQGMHLLDCALELSFRLVLQDSL